MAEFFEQELIINSTNWKVPKAKDQKFTVELWGAGGSGSCATTKDQVTGAGGGSGFYKSQELILEEGTEIQITIGRGGEGIDTMKPVDLATWYNGKTGSATTFGDTMIAAGGAGGNGTEGGTGGNNGGDVGEPGQGNYGCLPVTSERKGIPFSSGGGGSAIKAKGQGGSASRCSGDAGNAAGGAGCFVYTNGNTIHYRIGRGGDGICIISYIREA